MDILTCRKISKKLIIGEELAFKNLETEKRASKCRICNRICFYSYYGILSCEGCKQFFRRAVTKHTFYKCWQKTQNCDNITDVLEESNCRRCRLKKCLFMGMDPRKVIPMEGTDKEGHKKFIEKMKEWQNRLLQGENVQIENLKLTEPDFVQKLIDELKPIQRSHKWIWDSTRELPREYTNQHKNLAAFLADPENLLSKAEEYSNDPIEFYSKAEIISELEAKGLFLSEKMMRLYEKDWFLSVEIARAMPFFKKLDLNDKINLVKYIVIPFSKLICAYYSHAMCAKTMTRGNGFQNITISMEPKRYKNDKKIQQIVKVALCELVERMGQLGLEYKEFLLLMVILLANTNANNLSPSGRELIYKESVLYMNALQKMLQTKFGTFGGSERLMALMNLLNAVYKARNAQINFSIYLEVFYERQDPRKFLPEVFNFCLS